MKTIRIFALIMLLSATAGRAFSQHPALLKKMDATIASRQDFLEARKKLNALVTTPGVQTLSVSESRSANGNRKLTVTLAANETAFELFNNSIDSIGYLSNLEISSSAFPDLYDTTMLGSTIRELDKMITTLEAPISKTSDTTTVYYNLIAKLAEIQERRNELLIEYKKAVHCYIFPCTIKILLSE
ncbi:MAG: hypothetical protein KKA07_12595 [Bacteroidetes bacterium]|nr:hypothetical protein [Bacteroidota bacterium]MBU1719897.1 hypothetical protein [Bacteroidota bacterium]